MNNDNIPTAILSDYIDAWVEAGHDIGGTVTVDVIEDWVNNLNNTWRDVDFPTFARLAFEVDILGGSWTIR